MAEENLIVAVDQILPEKIFVVPLKYRPVYPGMVTPLVVPPGPLAESLEKVIDNANYLGLVMQKDDSRNGFDSDNVYRVGTLGKILKKMNLPNGGFHILLNTISRFSVSEFTTRTLHPSALVEYHRDSPVENDNEMIALTRSVLSTAKRMMNINPYFTEEMKVTLVNVEEPGRIADFVCSILNLEKNEHQEILETFDIRRRLEKTLSFLSREVELAELQQKIQGKVDEKIQNQQREHLLREQLKAIRNELGGNEKSDKDADYYRKKITQLNMPKETSEKVLNDVAKLENIEPQSNEYGVLVNYLDTIIELPWSKPQQKTINIAQARKTLDKDHFGLEDVKQRIIEHLSVRIMRKEETGSIICLVGPPGVGKTSLGKSIAKAMQKKFFRFSVGGMRDEAEIKGHRRTYIGAMPGKLIQALKVVKEPDPVLMLDEIDKMGSSYQGDPASALLEVLDPSQNHEFRDHYLDIPFDLSAITFITTANTLETIPGPLLDRMEVIALSGYILEEKVKIAQKYIIPRSIELSGLTLKNARKITPGALKAIIDGYSREAGVRNLEKQIQKIYRKNATSIVAKEKVSMTITEKELPALLGIARFKKESKQKITHAGTALGLAYTSMGGATLFIECTAIAGKERFKLTGQLGKVMTESADIALTYIQSITQDSDFWGKNQVHIHVPDGATPKDGPSAGVTIATALYSLYKKKPMKNGFAMTGELRLTGDVLPIGGLKEKTIAARRVGIKKIIFPADNQPDWDELPETIRKGMTPYPVSHFEEIMKLIF